jgi:enoyl-CoA hydratase
MLASVRTSGALSVAHEDAVLRIAFTRPDRLNAVTAEVLDDLADLLVEAGDDTGVRVVVLSGEGRAFSSGADLQGAVSGRADDAPRVSTLLAANRVVRALRAMPQPTIAAVNGPAAGVGCSLALGCDIVVAAESAYFLLSFTDVGLMPDGGATALVPASLGRSRALQLALAPERLSADRAHEWGLVHRVVTDDALAAAVAKLAARLVAGAPRAYAATKRAINDVTLVGLEEALTAEVAGQSELLGSADFREAVASFADKRPPSFTGE